MTRLNYSACLGTYVKIGLTWGLETIHLEARSELYDGREKTLTLIQQGHSVCIDHWMFRPISNCESQGLLETSNIEKI